MIWSHLCDSEDGAVQQIDDALLKDIKRERRHETTADDLWIIQACFVGDRARVEIVESRYRKVFSSFKCDSCRSISVSYDMATTDVYHTGFTPIQFVHKMELCWTINNRPNVDDALRDPQYRPQSSTRPSWKSCFDALDHIIDKAHFDMRMQFNGNGFSVKHLGHLLETFRPMYSELLAAGAKVRIVFRQGYLIGGDGPTDSVHVVEKHTDLTNFYEMDRLYWYDGFRKTIGGLDKEWGDPSRRRWDVEGDEEFDRAIASGTIRY